MTVTKNYKLYVRRYSSTVPAKQDEERELYNLAGNIPFDDRVHCTYAAIDNLLKQGSIEYTIPNKPTSKNQKYKLSSKL